jgi:hypothetical protein
MHFPEDIDLTEASTGTFTSFMDPASVKMTAPREYPLTVRRRLHVVGSSGLTVAVAEEETLAAGTVFNLSLHHVYVLDRRTMRAVVDDRAYAYAPNNTVDRSPNYTVGLPLDSTSDSFPFWLNETGKSCGFAADDPNVREHGVAFRSLVCRGGGVPAQGYFVDQLAAVGLPKQLSLRQIAPQLLEIGIDFQRIVDGVVPYLSTRDSAVLRSLLVQPIGLHYFVSYDRRLFAESQSGGILHAATTESIEVQFDLRDLSTAEAILSRRRYADKPVVVATLETLRQRIPKPPTYRVFTVRYSQTPKSIGDTGDYLARRYGGAGSAARLVPPGLLVTGFVVLSRGLVMTSRVSRRR